MGVRVRFWNLKRHRRCEPPGFHRDLLNPSRLWGKRPDGLSQRRMLANWAVVILLTGLLAACENEATTSINQELLRIDKELYLGHTYKVPIASYLLCPRPDLPINQGNDCVLTDDKGAIAVVDLVGSNGQIYGKLHLSNGSEGYILEEDLRRLDRQSHPSPKIGMTESEALDTSWGTPENKNVTTTGRHRSEQWVFPSYGYLYIEDGFLTTIQRTE
jgi:hypothetical protein